MTFSKDDFGYSVCPVVANDSVSVQKARGNLRGKTDGRKGREALGEDVGGDRVTDLYPEVSTPGLCYGHTWQIEYLILNSPVTSVLFPRGHKKNEAQRIEMTCPGHRAIK